MKLTIVMATFNRSEILKENISSLLKSSYDFELLVIDDGSNDNTEEVVRSFNDSRIKYFKHSVNKGYAQSLNDGIKLAKNPYLLFCEDDAFIVSPNKFFEILSKEMNNDTIIATHLLANGLEKKSNLYDRFKRYFAEPLCKEVYSYRGNRRKFVSFTNNCFCFRRDALNVTFDSSSFVGNLFRIESDFQLRARKKGARILYNPNLVIDHRKFTHGGLRVNNADEFYYQCMVNHLIFLHKHYSVWNIIWYLLLRILFDLRRSYLVIKALKNYEKIKDYRVRN